jgi:hypothetical protein
MAKHAPDAYRAVHAEVTPRLYALANRPGSGDDDEAAALVTENCVAALGAVAAIVAGPDQAALLQFWLSKLPLRVDEAEAKLVHSQLCTFIEGGHPAIVGDGFVRLPVVVSVLAQLLEAVEEEEDVVDAATAARVTAIFRMIQTQLPAPQVAEAWAGLSPDQQGAVQRALSA